MKLFVKNWAEFQHYKDRSPPWIKLHKELLDDKSFQRLPVASRALAPMLWLLASESKDGSFDGSIDELAFRLRQSEKEITSGLEPLIENGFFITEQDASEPLAERLQVAVPETEAEAYKPEAETEAPAADVFVLPEWIPAETWKSYCKTRTAKKAKNEPHALGLIVADLEKFRDRGFDPVEILNSSIKSGWAGVFEPKANARASPGARLEAVNKSNTAGWIPPEMRATA